MKKLKKFSTFKELKADHGKERASKKEIERCHDQIKKFIQLIKAKK